MLELVQKFDKYTEEWFREHGHRFDATCPYFKHNIFQARVERRYITDYYYGSRSALKQRRSHEVAPNRVNIENNRPWLSTNEKKLAKRFPFKATAHDFELKCK